MRIDFTVSHRMYESLMREAGERGITMSAVLRERLGDVPPTMDSSKSYRKRTLAPKTEPEKPRPKVYFPKTPEQLAAALANKKAYVQPQASQKTHDRVRVPTPAELADLKGKL